MKLEKAAEILNLELTGPACLSNPDLKDAIRLGTEALNTILILRHYPFPNGIIRLHGETLPTDSP